jgi:hypothetical protein
MISTYSIPKMPLPGLEPGSGPFSEDLKKLLKKQVFSLTPRSNNQLRLQPLTVYQSAVDLRILAFPFNKENTTAREGPMLDHYTTEAC